MNEMKEIFDKDYRLMVAEHLKEAKRLTKEQLYLKSKKEIDASYLEKVEDEKIDKAP